MQGTMEFNRRFDFNSFRFVSLAHLRDLLKCSAFFPSYRMEGHKVYGRRFNGELHWIGTVELDA